MKQMMNWLPASRRWIIWVTLVILLLLDAGRSVYARIGYAQPAEPWQEAPYDVLVWPPTDAALSASTTLGERVYLERCALCHGINGQGNGPAAVSMIPRPADFTLGKYKYTSTPAGRPPTDEDLYQVIANGLTASGMPYWSDILSDEEIRAVIETIKGFSAVFDGVPAQPITIPDRVQPDTASIARGKQLYNSVGCAGCHDVDLRGDNTFQDSKGYPVRSRNLTAPWTFRGGSEPAQLWLRLTNGLAPGPMPAHTESMSATERWDVVNYILSEARTPPWEPGGVLDGPGYHADPVKRGEYLVHAEMCGLCHTQVSADLRYSGDDYYLAGGMGIPVYPQGVFVSRNLTSDPETGLGNWSAEEIADAVRNGRSPERPLNFWAMPWMYLHTLTEPDALAIGSYLKTLPPVKNQIPQPLWYGVVESIVAKAFYSRSVPPVGNALALVYKDGNYGQTDPGLLSRDWPQQVLIWAQRIIFAGGIIAYVLAGRSVSRQVSTKKRGCLKTGLLIGGLLFLWLLGWVMANTPALSFIPPEQINKAVTTGIYQVNQADFASPEEAALAERGQYLFTVTSCAMCHNNDGSGGLKISSRESFGSVWARNITPDPETGIGNWRDAEIARAIRTGVSQNGRPLHWQGMIWDHLSNLDEEDVQALIVYLRALPPVHNEVPVSLPPDPSDCAEYTFYLQPSNTPGCE